MDGVVDWSVSAPLAEQLGGLVTAHQIGMGALVLAATLFALLAIGETVAPAQR